MDDMGLGQTTRRSKTYGCTQEGAAQESRTEEVSSALEPFRIVTMRSVDTNGVWPAM